MRKPERSWTFLTSHAHVLLAPYRDPDLLQRQIAKQVGVTEGRVHGTLSDLQNDGYVRVQRRGWRNHYLVDAPLGFGVSDRLSKISARAMTRRPRRLQLGRQQERRWV